jgi:hypothetical protein
MDFKLDFTGGSEPTKKIKSKPRACKITEKKILRRAFSEVSLMDIFPHELEKGASYYVLTNGDIDSFSFLKFMLRRYDLEYLLFSTWCMAIEDIIEIEKYIDNGKIKNIDAYLGEIFQGSYPKQYSELKRVISKTNGRIALFRNHSKVYAGKSVDGTYFAISSSANINTNPRCENTIITMSKEIFYFYKKFYDEIKSFKNDFENWKPYKIKD